MALLLLASLALATPPTLQVVYTARFDLDATGDGMCEMTKLCDCTATYVGKGTEVHRDEGRVTFQGSFAQKSSDCHDTFAIWVPADGEAFHTLRFADGSLTEWVVHDQASGHARLASGMKAAGQFWINELAQPWPFTKAKVEQTDGSDLGGLMKVNVGHTLALTLE